MVDYWQTIIEKESRVGRTALSSSESECYLLYRSVCEFENGGLSGLLYNISPDWEYFVALADLLKRKGEFEFGTLIQEVHSIGFHPSP